MLDHAYHQELRLRRFTVFQDAHFSFSPGINALVGENGTGKTHLMKVLYAVQLAAMRGDMSLREPLAKLFQVADHGQLTRHGSAKGHPAPQKDSSVTGDGRWPPTPRPLSARSKATSQG